MRHLYQGHEYGGIHVQGTLTINTKDVDKTCDFYSRVMGMEVSTFKVSICPLLVSTTHVSSQIRIFSSNIDISTMLDLAKDH